jgi:protein-tyrosine-phosphatase
VGIEEFTDLRLRLDQATNQLESEFAGIYDRAYIKSVVDASAEQLAGAEVASFVPILAHRFARERLRAQAQAEGKLDKALPQVLFVSLTGGGRAQMAAALLERSARSVVACHTAGTAARGSVDPTVREAMAEVDIDLSEEFSRPLSPEVLAHADIVVTMGRSVGSIEIPESTRHVDWRVGDPAGAPIAEVRRVRDDIDRRVQLLVDELTGSTAATPEL